MTLGQKLKTTAALLLGIMLSFVIANTNLVPESTLIVYLKMWLVYFLSLCTGFWFLDQVTKPHIFRVDSVYFIPTGALAIIFAATFTSLANEIPVAPLQGILSCLLAGIVMRITLSSSPETK